jgi:16S rRNA processing protein RimM
VNPGDWIAVGRLVRTRGNRGELLGEIYSGQAGRGEKLKDVMLERGGRRRASAVERLWYHGGRPVFKFAGIDSISDAEPWEGAEVLVASGDRVVPGEGEYLHADLIGCTVLCGEARLGVVTGIEEYGGPPLLKVESGNGREILIPFAGAICREIDVGRKIICVELPEGLTEI